MHGTIVVAIFVFMLLCAIAIAGREPQPAAIALLFGAGWPATLLTGYDLLRGAFLLAGLLIVLVGRARAYAGAPVRARRIGLVVLAAVALSSSPALAKHGFLDWQKWDFYTRPAKPVSVSYVWNSSYFGVQLPEEEDRRPQDQGLAEAALLARGPARRRGRRALAAGQRPRGRRGRDRPRAWARARGGEGPPELG